MEPGECIEAAHARPTGVRGGQQIIRRVDQFRQSGLAPCGLGGPGAGRAVSAWVVLRLGAHVECFLLPAATPASWELMGNLPLGHESGSKPARWLRAASCIYQTRLYLMAGAKNGK